MDCPERDRLLDERDRAYDCHAKALERFRLRGTIAPPDEYRRLETAVSDALIDLRLAETVLGIHLRLHRCESRPF